MTTYQYKALDEKGKQTRGIMRAQDEYAAVQKIRETCPVILEIREVKEKDGSFLSMDIGGKSKIKSQQLSVLCSQFAVMLKSGMPVSKTIEMVARQTENKGIRKMLLNISEDVSGGSTVAGSFERNGKGIFPVTFIETIRAGEESGTLENSFDKLKDYYEKSFRNAEKIKSAMTYPVFVLLVAAVVIIIVMAKVIPTIANVFSSLGGNLPLMTRALIASSNFFAKWWIVILIILLAIVLGVKLYNGTPRGRLAKGRRQLKMPVLGKINLMNGSAQFADTMSVMLQSGLTVNRAVEVTAKVMDNEILKQDIAAMTGKIEEGHSLGECISRCQWFPENLVQMVSIGEETGDLSETLDTIGGYYSNEADYMTRQALAKLEPAMLVLIAVIAGFIVISIYLPMFTMYNLF